MTTRLRQTIRTIEEAAYFDGCQAYANGKAIESDNPHIPNTRLHTAWREGWEAAERDEAIEYDPDTGEGYCTECYSQWEDAAGEIEWHNYDCPFAAWKR